jgi:ligand-binding sensor domain-containing protein
MATRPDTARTTVNEGVSEAIRATSQMSHLTLDIGGELWSGQAASSIRATKGDGRV